jgi:hypothetical protein
MTTPPARPSIFHITPVENLGAIVADGVLKSDALMIAAGGPATAIGLSPIKQRRLTYPVTCHPGDCVGDCVPFYFCPRSIMLFVIHCDNNPELTYHGGQDRIVHLEADLHEVVEWADANDRRWAFSLSNAGGQYAEFRSDLAELDQVNWVAVQATDFRAAEIREGKQAEFLVRDEFPWSLIKGIGVKSAGIASQVENILASADHQPPVKVRNDWYFPPR